MTISETASTPIRGYIEAISDNWPKVFCHTQGTRYEDLVWEGGDPIPPKIILDMHLLKASKSTLEDALLNHLNVKAQERGYTTILSAALRAAYQGPYHDEGVVYGEWMDACWRHLYELLATDDFLTVEKLLTTLPTLSFQE